MLSPLTLLSEQRPCHLLLRRNWGFTLTNLLWPAITLCFLPYVSIWTFPLARNTLPNPNHPSKQVFFSFSGAAHCTALLRGFHPPAGWSLKCKSKSSSSITPCHFSTVWQSTLPPGLPWFKRKTFFHILNYTVYFHYKNWKIQTRRWKSNTISLLT